VSNSLKHAFPDGRTGRIKIVMKSLNKDEIELTAGDNGIGIPDDVDFRETESLGLHLVSILAEDQLRGKIKLDKTKGTRFQIKFKAKQ
jgi:two-component sensor histidine kinase